MRISATSRICGERDRERERQGVQGARGRASWCCGSPPRHVTRPLHKCPRTHTPHAAQALTPVPAAPSTRLLLPTPSQRTAGVSVCARSQARERMLAPFLTRMDVGTQAHPHPHALSRPFTHTHTHTHMLACMHARTCARTHVRMPAHPHPHTHTHTHILAAGLSATPLTPLPPKILSRITPVVCLVQMYACALPHVHVRSYACVCIVHVSYYRMCSLTTECVLRVHCA